MTEFEWDLSSATWPKKKMPIKGIGDEITIIINS